MNDLRKYLVRKLEEHKERNPEDNKSLLGDLLEWGSAVHFKGTLYDAIEEQINYRASRRGISPREFIDSLFSRSDHESWMLSFQS